MAEINTRPEQKTVEIRNSTAEFLIFQIEGKEDGVQVLYRDETIWCIQKAMSVLFDVGIPAISKHLKNIIESGELNADSVISKMETTAETEFEKYRIIQDRLFKSDFDYFAENNLLPIEFENQ